MPFTKIVNMLPALKERSDENGWQLEKMEVMPDHVLATPSESSVHIVSQLKGYTSYKLREESSPKKRIPALWTKF
ncbi:Transposase IS200 like family protein [Bacteroides fragilis]